MTATLDDFPDPAEPVQRVQYDFVLRQRDRPATSTTSSCAPGTRPSCASSPPIGRPTSWRRSREWTIGTLLAGSADQIFLTLEPVALLPKGTTAQVRIWVTDDSGATASAIESTRLRRAERALRHHDHRQAQEPQRRRRCGGDLHDRDPQRHGQLAERHDHGLPPRRAHVPRRLAAAATVVGQLRHLELPHAAARRDRLRSSCARGTPRGHAAGDDAWRTWSTSATTSGNVAEKSYIGHVRGRHEQRAATDRDHDGPAHDPPRCPAALHAAGEEHRAQSRQECGLEAKHSRRTRGWSSRRRRPARQRTDSCSGGSEI